MDAKTLNYIEKANEHRFKDGLSRRRFMGGLVAAAGGVAGAGALGTTSVALADDVPTMINTAITAEALAVTYLGAVIEGAFAVAVGPLAVVKAVLVAARAEEQDHYNYLAAAGAKPLTTTFTVPASANPADPHAALSTIAAAEGLFVNAYLAACNEFASQGNYKLATVAASILGVEAEHRALARVALAITGDDSFNPADNVSFEPAPLPSVSAVGQKLKDLGFIGGSGTPAQYPGPGAIDPTGVTSRTPPSLTPEHPGCPPQGGGNGQGGNGQGNTNTAPGMPNTGEPVAGGFDVPGALLGAALGGGGAVLIGALRSRISRSRE